MTPEPGRAEVEAAMIGRLGRAIYRILEQHDAEPECLSIFGSLGDTLTLAEVVDAAESYIRDGKVLHAKH